MAQQETKLQYQIKFSASSNKFKDAKHDIIRFIENKEAQISSDQKFEKFVHPAGTVEILQAAAKQDAIVPRGNAQRFSSKMKLIPGTLISPAPSNKKLYDMQKLPKID